eukprot:GILK01006337.1.p1 GENE.GILK01006337.1~~GILK01006337.1.p1  ORF type:complete len:198 (+),score=44.21 GILK01006337.1:40-633(+)
MPAFQLDEGQLRDKVQECRDIFAANKARISKCHESIKRFQGAIEQNYQELDKWNRKVGLVDELQELLAIYTNAQSQLNDCRTELQTLQAGASDSESHRAQTQQQIQQVMDEIRSIEQEYRRTKERDDALIKDITDEVEQYVSLRQAEINQGVHQEEQQLKREIKEMELRLSALRKQQAMTFSTVDVQTLMAPFEGIF